MHGQPHIGFTLKVFVYHTRICQFQLLCEGWPKIESQSVCSILCECGRVYMGQTGCSVETRMEEHLLVHPS